jgi:hypothetical protein
MKGADMRYRHALATVVAPSIGATGCSILSDDAPTPAADRGPAAVPSEPPAQPVPWRPIPAQPLSSVPLADDPVSVRLVMDDHPHTKQGTRFAFVVRLLNRGGHAVPLTPCPAYRVQFNKVVEVGTLNCAEAPSRIPSHGHIDFDMQVWVQRRGWAILPQVEELLWQLGGEGYEGQFARTDVRMVRA